MRIRHGRITLELDQIAEGNGVPLLLFHALFGSSADWGEAPAPWPGPVYALDFCGHGRSDWLTGGGYYPELLAGDADAALAHIGRAAVAGAGLGAYVAVLLAGARRETVAAALLLPGAGLEGGGAVPDFTKPHRLIDGLDASAMPTCEHDPMLRALETDVRPPEYIGSFARTARHLLLVEDGEPRPPWWQTVRGALTAEVVDADIPSALARLAQLSG
jgi:pimeloyl-ACP methyl ester carboxylesterase